MATRLSRENEDYVTFQADHDIKALEDFITRARAAGVKTEWFDASLEKYKRLQRAHITDIHELRAALREYVGHRAEARGDDPVKVAERELIGKKLLGFFPTPLAIIERMLALAEIEPHHHVLEPSCGKGDILDALRNRYPALALVAVEQNRTLADVLSAKGHEVQFDDFLEHRGKYDRIVMNPPFESGAEIEHIRHAYTQLHSGGRLVSVVSEGPFFRADRKSVAFREWLEELSAEIEQLPDGSFAGEDVFRQSSVRTRLITVSKDARATGANSRS
jgi:type I restriction-modification system DNA methylase subunit